MLWVSVVVVVFYLFSYCLLSLRRPIRRVTYVGPSFWVVCGLMFVWVGRECILIMGPRRVSTPFRGIGALGPGVGVGVSIGMLWGFIIYVRGEGIVHRCGMPGI